MEPSTDFDTWGWIKSLAFVFGMILLWLVATVVFGFIIIVFYHIYMHWYEARYPEQFAREGFINYDSEQPIWTELWTMDQHKFLNKFFDLPPEIRLMIYKMVLEDELDLPLYTLMQGNEFVRQTWKG